MDSQIQFVLTQLAARLEAHAFTQDKFIELLSELAAASWIPPDDQAFPVTIDPALASLPPGVNAPAFVQLALDCGFLIRTESVALRFRDAWLHGYLAARRVARFLAVEYSDQRLTRDHAVRDLERIGVPAIPVMIECLASPDDDTCLGAAVVLRQIGPSAVPALVEAISFGNQRVRRWVVEALSSEQNSDAALPALIRVVENDDRPLVVTRAVVALGMSRNVEGETVLIAALRHSDSLVRMFSKQALESFDSPRARRALDELARHSATRSSQDACDTHPDPPRIFISYAREDINNANEIRHLLRLAGFDPWMDSGGLLAGELWESRLVEVVRTSDFVVALLSEHTAGGYQETELRMAVQNTPRNRSAHVPFLIPCAFGKLLRGSDLVLPECIDKDRLIGMWSVSSGWRELHETLYTGAQAAGLSAPQLLRTKGWTDLDETAVNRMIAEKNFFDISRNKQGRPAALDYRTFLNGSLVHDPATGRTWPRNCGEPLPYLGERSARLVAWKANADRVGNANDWRLPTLEEAMSLMRTEPNARGNFIAGDFSDDGYVLTCDTFIVGTEPLVWVACYAHGDCQPVPAREPAAAVRLVRTEWDHLRA